ncbi:MAG TPA: hypothetical protein PLO63_00285 [Syntrophales bacterium]|nr:hypothetical protein [Syntrophales bacterium]
MKRHGNLFEKIASFDNLYWASREARRGKRMKEGTAAFEMNLEQELVCLREELLEKRYRPGPYREFTIYDRKQRKISAAPTVTGSFITPSARLSSRSSTGPSSTTPTPAGWERGPTGRWTGSPNSPGGTGTC